MEDPVYPNRANSMSDPLHPSQPLITDPERALPEYATPSELGHIPVERGVNPRLNSAAESVGSALGTAVVQVRRVPDRLQEAKKRFTVITGRKGQDAKYAASEATDKAKVMLSDAADKAKVAVNDATDRARVVANDAAVKAREVGEDLRENAQVKFEQARVQVQRLGHEYPLETIGAAAAFGVFTGIVLRVWRDHAS